MEQVTGLSDEQTEASFARESGGSRAEQGQMERRSHHLSTVAVVGALMSVLLIAGLGYTFWPFRYRRFEPLLQRIFASKVTIDHYHCVFFPYPGMVAEGLTLRRNATPGSLPVGTARRLVVEGR